MSHQLPRESGVIRGRSHTTTSGIPTSINPQLPNNNEAKEIIQSGMAEFFSKKTFGPDSLIVCDAVDIRDEHTGTLLKPDFVVFPHHLPRAADAAVAVIEVKSKDTPEPLLQRSTMIEELAHSLRAFLQVQPHRQFIYGILTNGIWCQLLKAQRHRLGQAVEYRYVLMDSSSEGKFHVTIKWLLSQSLKALGYAPPTIFFLLPQQQRQQQQRHSDVISLEGKMIGSGTRSVAYGLSIANGSLPSELFRSFVKNNDDETVVVKTYHDSQAAYGEAGILALLGQKGVSHVTRLLPEEYQPSVPNCLAVTPRGFHFDEHDHILRLVHIQQLLKALTAMHAHNVTHNDIHRRNILWVSATEAVLNDFSHAQRWVNGDNDRDYCEAAKKNDLKSLWLTLFRLPGHAAVEYFTTNVISLS